MVMTSQNKIPLRADFVKSLRMLPDLSNDQLKQIASNTNDPLSTFAIAVLNSKQISANSSQNANQPTIANQVLAKENASSGLASLTSPPATMMASNMQAPTEPAQGGVSTLPIREDMFNEKNYAGGGIVAFQEGGDTNVFGFKRGTSLMEKYLPSEFSNAQSAIIPTLMGEKARLEKEIQANPNKRYENYERIKQIDTQLLEAKAPRTKGGYDASLEAPAMTDTEVSLKKAIEEVKTNPFADKAAYAGSTVPVEKIKGLADYAKDLQDYVGPDKNIALQKERIAKMEARAKRMENMAPGMAMLEAGLDIASGTSPYALVNVGRGKSGVKSYAESQEKLANLEERRFGLENDLSKAERAEQIAIAKYGADSKQAAEARAHADKLHNSSISTQYKIAELNATVNQQNRLIAAKDKIEDNVRAKIKTIHGEGTLSPEEYDKYFKKYLAEAYAQYGVAGAPAVTNSMPGNMVFDPKTKEYTYKPTK
tara:strand:- start:6860 stop:8305 length:1446 start_codon:yes stop_codon:yes gene_type:complete